MSCIDLSKGKEQICWIGKYWDAWNIWSGIPLEAFETSLDLQGWRGQPILSSPLHIWTIHILDHPTNTHCSCILFLGTISYKHVRIIANMRLTHDGHKKSQRVTQSFSSGWRKPKCCKPIHACNCYCICAMRLYTMEISRLMFLNFHSLWCMYKLRKLVMSLVIWTLSWLSSL